MSTPPFLRTAFTLETFLDQAGIADTPKRRQLEERLVQGLASRPALYDALVYDQGRVIAYLDGRVELSESFDGAHPTLTLWCNDRRLSLMEPTAYRTGAAWVFLGVGGLATMATAQTLLETDEEEARRDATAGGGGSFSGDMSTNNNNTNNNNNNNNNNNG